MQPCCSVTPLYITYTIILLSECMFNLVCVIHTFLQLCFVGVMLHHIACTIIQLDKYILSLVYVKRRVRAGTK